MLESRINLILNEFERVPEYDELREIYSCYFNGFQRQIPKESKVLLDKFKDPFFIENLEKRLSKVEYEITTDQLNIIHNIVSRKRLIIPFGTGIGKTLPAIGASYAIGKVDKPLQTVIISPKTNGLKTQWAHRINKYSHEGVDNKIVVIDNEKVSINQDNVKLLYDINNKQNQQFLNEADFIILNYHMVPKWKEFLPKNAYGIIDESHNHRNENGHNIASEIKCLTKDYNYLALLTATPMYNTITDIEHQIRIVSGNDDFRIPRITLNRLKITQALLREYMLLPAQTLKDKLYTPDGKKIIQNEFPEPIELSSEHMALYNQLFESDGPDLIRFNALREFAFDPQLLFLDRVNGAQVMSKLVKGIIKQKPEFESNIYKRMLEIVQEKYQANEKTIIYSEFIEGVTQKVQSQLDQINIPTLIYDANDKKKNLVRRLFQIEPYIGAIIGSSQSMSEGASYTAANNSIYIVPVYQPSKITQGDGREFRPGQLHENVNTYFLYAIGTLNEGIFHQTNVKKNGILGILSSGNISQEQLDEIYNKNILKSKGIKQYLHRFNKGEFLRNLLGLLMNKNPRTLEKIISSDVNISKELSGNIGEMFATHYNEDFDKKNHANVARAYSQILKNYNLGNILDAAGGAATASRILGVETTILDINKYQLEAGRIACSKLGLNNTYIQSSLQSMEIEKEKYNTIIYSLAFSWAPKNDRVKILKNLNQSLKKDGILVLTIHGSGIHDDYIEPFKEGINKLGYSVLEENTGRVIARNQFRSPVIEQSTGESHKNNKQIRFDNFILEAKKQEYIDEKVDSKYFRLKSKITGTKKVKPKDNPSDILIDIMDSFYNKQEKEGEKYILEDFIFADGRRLGEKDYIQKEIVSYIENFSSKNIKPLANKLKSLYKENIVYGICETLVEKTNLADLGTKTYKKVERLFDYLTGLK